MVLLALLGLSAAGLIGGSYALPVAGGSTDSFATRASALTVPDCKALLYISINPILDDVRRVPRAAQVNWDYDNCEGRPARAVLFQHPKHEKNPESILEIEPDWSGAITEEKGSLVTNFTVLRDLPLGWGRNDSAVRRYTRMMNGDACLDFRVALLDKDDTIINVQCLKIQANWISELAIRKTPLGLADMMIPGTHNSACYPKYRGYEGHVTPYLLTQDLDVWEQLVMGARYFDLRVGYYPMDMGDQENETHPDHGQRFWVNHDMVRLQPLLPILTDIKDFLQRATREIVIIDFHRFPVGFGSSAYYSESEAEPHKQLTALIEDFFGNIMIPFDPENIKKPIWKLVETDQRVLVSYNEKAWQTKPGKERLWPGIPQHWGNKQELPDLMEYLNAAIRDVKASPKLELFSLMAELTPTMFDILLTRPNTSLRSMAERVSWDVTYTARCDAFWRRHANVIALDYIESTDIVQVAIEVNNARSRSACAQMRCDGEYSWLR